MLPGARILFERRGLSAKSYVQGGLAAMWDGIENAGWGVHDPNATAWRELVSGAECAYSVSGETPNWVSDGWESVVTDQKFFSAFCPDGLAEHHTVQLVVTKSTANVQYRGIIFGSYGMSNSNNCGFEYRPSSSSRKIFRAYYHSPDFSTPDIWELGVPAAFSVTHDPGSYIIIHGTETVATNSSTYNNMRASVMRIGADSRPLQFTFGGIIHAIRLYSRALTAAEIAANYAVDKARFNLP